MNPSLHIEEMKSTVLIEYTYKMLYAIVQNQNQPERIIIAFVIADNDFE